MKVELTDRLSNYDALRIISTVAVIFIHVNWEFLGYRSLSPSLEINYVIESIINIITRFSVPAFVMISGAFNLKYKKNGDFVQFYCKASWKIFVPTTIAIVLLFLYDVIKGIFWERCLLLSVKGIFEGGYYNLWFLYMLVGLYLLTPFLVRLKSVISKEVYICTSFFLLVWAVVSQALSTQKVPYTIGVVFAFLGYYLMGDVILSYITLKHRPAFYFIFAGFMFFLTFIVRYAGVTYYLSNSFTNFFSPFVSVASICIFAGVKGIHINKDLSWLSSKMFYIYVFHTIIISFLFKVAEIMVGDKYELLQEVIIVVLTFGIALIVSIIYDAFWKSKYEWKEKWFSLKIWKKLYKYTT